MADYIHRAGRVGRFGSDFDCSVTNFVSNFLELDLVRNIEYTARTQSVLPNVDANTTKIRDQNIQKHLRLKEAKDSLF